MKRYRNKEIEDNMKFRKPPAFHSFDTTRVPLFQKEDFLSDPFIVCFDFYEIRKR